MKKLVALLVSLCAGAANAQLPMKYSLAYPSAGVNTVQVRIDLRSPRPAPVVLVMPSNYPGGYEFAHTIRSPKTCEPSLIRASLSP